jgi:hypothetical protein
MKRTRYLIWLFLLTACVDPRGAATHETRVADVASSVATDSAFARLIRRLSEPGGYFDTDNLISNETSYLHVLGKLDEMRVEGGAYIGVGPDQNFSYIARTHPDIAFIVDIRRDNLLQHLMFKALFALSRNRLDYLCHLFARPLPEDVDVWDERSLEDLLDYIDGAPLDPALAEMEKATIVVEAAQAGVPLSDADRTTISRFHAEFVRGGLDLRFRSYGRRPRPYYPTYRQLLLERDLTGRQGSYLAREEDFRFLKSLQARNLIVPVVGNLAGDHALLAIGRYLERHGEHVSVLYTSNVEFYLADAGSFDRYARNVAGLPFIDNSVIIRSFFGRNFGFEHPQAVPGYYSVQLLQTIESFVDDQASGGYRSYLDLVTRRSLSLN